MNGSTELSERELLELASTYDLPVNEATLADLTAQVNTRLTAELKLLYDYNLDTSVPSPGARKWSEPADDEYNAISVSCRVPPTDDASNLLSGLEIGLKDNISVAGVPMTCGSQLLQGYVPGSDATVVRRLREAGATITAKTNMDEFAVGGRGVSSDGKIINPRDPTRSTGGSSGGSAAAVAADVVDAALGTDTGGSVRMPAAFCGLVGLKPSYGLVSNAGVFENTYTLDHVGPITNTVEDAARILSAIVGKDSNDPASMQAAGENGYRIDDYIAAVSSPPALEDIRLGILSTVASEPVHNGVQENNDAALDVLEEAAGGLEILPFDDLDAVVQVKNAISYCELAAHWRDGTIGYRRGGDVGEPDPRGVASRLRLNGAELNDFHRSRILAGATLVEVHGGHHYTRACAIKKAITVEIETLLQEVDVIITPTVPHPAPKLDADDDPDALDGRPLGTGRYTKIGNVTGLPAITIPNGSYEGAPIGLQLIGRRFDEANLLAVAFRISEEIDSAEDSG